MEHIVNKLRSTVTSTVSNVNKNINNILPGNPVTRDYEITGCSASAGPGLIWKIYSGFKKRTKEEASIFVLQKKILDKYCKRDRELIMDIIRKGVTQLTKIRHPSVLLIQHGLEESRDSLAFATEPVFASLANIFGKHDNIDTPYPQELTEFEFYDVEITYGILQISEGLAFLHSDAKLLHRNISPENIILNKKGSWRLAGFDFAVSPVNPNDFPLRYPFLNITNQASDYPVLALPNLDHVAPEYITSASAAEPSLTASADIFSLGSLLYYIFNRGKPLIPTGDSLNSMTPARVEKLAKLPSNAFAIVPDGFRHKLPYLLNVDPTMRPDAHQFAKLEAFDDVHIRTLQYLDSLFQFDNLERSKFYKGLPNIMSPMPKRIKLDRVFQCLTKEFVNSDMVPFVLPSVFQITQELSNDEFVESILPHLTVVFQMKEPIQIPVLLLQNMELLLNKLKSNQDSIRSHLLPILCCCLENNSNEVAELCLATLPSVAHLIDPSSMKNSIISRIKKLCSNSNHLSTRVKCLLCIANLLPNLDKWLVLDDIVPFLTSLPTREPAIIMAIIGILKLVLNDNKLGLTKDIMATKVIPFLMPLSIENGLSTNQFVSIISLIKEMISLVEKEQKSKLEQLDNFKSQRDSAVVQWKPSTATTTTSNKLKEVDFYFQTESQPSLPDSSSENTKPKAIEYFSMNDNSETNSSKASNTSSNSNSNSLSSLISSPSNQSNRTMASESFPKIPSSGFTPPKPNQPKDLTSSLIDANLRNISNLNGANRSIPSQTGVVSPMSAFSSQPALMAGNSFNSFNSHTNSMSSNFSGFMGSSQQSRDSLSSFPINNSKSPGQARSNTSSLDNLPLPGLSNNNSSGPPLNAILKPVSIAPNPLNSSTNQQGLNKLSKNDLYEFLS
ncbi:SCY1-like protein 2 [Brevipalpus obovatus]|uniref:SCY1-like protein 2 n=1 Tax=Brevipalpus obovatus TaxID=246614 RepID=UPI003D9F86C0